MNGNRTAATIKLTFPLSITLDAKVLAGFQSHNPDLYLELKDSNLIIHERELHFSQMDFFKLHLPFKMREEELFELDRLNNNLKLEGEEGLILINMGTSFFIGTFTVAILGTLYIWNRKMKLGKVTDSSTGHDLEINGKKKHRIPDVSFIAFTKFAHRVLDMSSRAGSPTLCIEVVSHKKSLKQDLAKMAEDWMAGGADIGLVVCPHHQKYYVFERDRTGYNTVSFARPFTHSLLPQLELDFAALLAEAIEETKRAGAELL
ncbi:MAG: Uma2 family endonuclease [Leptospiraceae bacterium]|nr:Uma2 family endonuclease [Leptospiraceae bacterium]